MDKNKLFRLAKTFRNAIEACDKSRLPVTFSKFPNGACGDASLLLAKFLQEHGYGSFDYVCGERNGHSHAWLQAGDLVVDVTGDQFEDNKRPVVVESKSSWHADFNEQERRIADLQNYDNNTLNILGSAYQVIIENLK
jgi:hypothetical protein